MGKYRFLVLVGVFLLGVAVGIGVASLQSGRQRVAPAATPMPTPLPTAEKEQEFLSSLASNTTVVRISAIIQGDITAIDDSFVHIAEKGQQSVALIVDENTEITEAVAEAGGAGSATKTITRAALRVGDRVTAQASLSGQTLWVSSMVVRH